MCSKIVSKLCLTAALGPVLLLLVPASAWATAYAWTGTTSNVWNLDTNWGQTSGSGLYPGSAVAYADTATIGTVITNTPVSLSTLATLGGGATVLTLSNVAGSATGLDIAGTGILGVQGNIVLSSGTTNGRKITIEGTLRNDAASSATTYTISGGTNAGDFIQLIGGTISSQNGGKWTFSRPVQGYGTISSVFTGTVLANVASQTLHITNPAESIAAGSLTNTGGILSLENIAVTSGTLNVTGSGLTVLTGGTFTGTINASAGEVDINGTTLNSVSNISGTVKLTGNSAANTVSITNLLFNGNKLDVTGTVTNFGSIHVDAGVLNNASTSATTAVSNGSQLYLAGGSITNTGGSGFTFATNVQGYGSVSGITGFTGPGFTANGGTVATPQTMTWIGGGVTLGTHSGSGATLSAAANTTLDLQGTFNVINPGIIAPSTGTVALDGATINTYDPTGGVGSTPTTWNETVNAGAISVPNDSTLIGMFTSAANFTINPSKQLTMTGATVNLSAGSMTNSGTFNIGAGKLNNSAASLYSLGGLGSTTLAGGTVSSSGGGGITSTNTVIGYGNVTAPFTNGGQVKADGGGVEQIMSFSGAITGTLNGGSLGWFAQNKGTLTLPSMPISGPGDNLWGGDISMVDSVKTTVNSETGSGSLAIALLDPLNTGNGVNEVPAGLVNPIGVWDFTQTGVTINSADLTFRYNDGLAATDLIPESSLGLFHFDGTNWNPVSATLNTSNHTLFAPGVTSFSDYAVAVVPEPGTIVMLGGFGLSLGLLWWRRKRADA